MRADRLLSILMLLQTRGKQTTQALAAELGVSRRTILRDIQALSLAGVPVYSLGGHGGGVGLDEAYRTTLTGLHEAEIRGLFAAGSTRLLNEIGLGEATQRTLHKLAAALPVTQQSLVERVRQRIYMDPLWWWQDGQPLPFWNELQTAVFDDRPVRAVYENYRGTAGERLLEPYSLVAKAATWYLLARREGEFRLYKVARFHSIELLPGHFERMAGFDLEVFWAEHVQAFREATADYSFTLRIRSDRLAFAQATTPGHYRILAEENGWAEVRFQLESVELAQMLVFGLGRHAVVLDPPELTLAVREQARAVLGRTARRTAGELES